MAMNGPHRTATCNGENSAAGNGKTNLSHNPGISIDWTPEEQSILEDLFPKLAEEPSIVIYAEIAKALTDKTVRDVAFRCRWMNEKVTNHTNAESMTSLDSDDGNSFYAIGGVADQLLEQNLKAFEQISANFSSYKINDNLDLFRQARSNILTILNDCNNVMPKTMPPLPVRLNDELAKQILDQPLMQ